MTTFNRPNSILTQAYITSVVFVAKADLERDTQLIASLFVKPKGPTGFVFRLPDLPSEAAQRYLYFTNLGVRLKRELGEIEEAVFLSETWWTPVASTSAGGKGATSPQSVRQEAIMVVGRNVANTCHSVLMQSFTRDRVQNPVWGKIVLESYGRPDAL